MSDTSDLIDSVKDWVRKSKVVDVVQKVDAAGHALAHGNLPWSQPAGLNMPKLAQEQADRSLGKKPSPLNSTMTPIKKASK